MPKRWRIKPHDPDRIADLERSAGIPAVVAQLLICRGIEKPGEVREFLAPKLSGLHEPEELPGASEAAERIWAAIREKKRIIIYGDYDVDGISGTATLLLCLRLLGADVGYHIPDRMNDGYGLREDNLRRLADEGAKLIVTVDCGIASVAEAEVARELGLELIITDHHEMNDRLPNASVLVHPRLPGGNYPFSGLCGSGVAFKVAWAVCQQASGGKKASPRMRDFLMQSVVFAALGTVADVVPLVDENRILVRHGLIGLKERPTVGLRMLMKVAGLDKKSYLSAEDIGFGVAPRLNAAGRLGQARLAVELLTTDSEPRAKELADYIDGLNATRKSLERSIYLSALKQAKRDFDPEGDAALVLSSAGWHAGVIGIVAGRLAEKFYRPVVLISQDELGVKPAVGSARSVPGFNLHEALRTCSHHLISHGGHAAAAGLKIEDKAIDAFRTEFCEYAAGEIPQERRVAELRIDAETSLSALTLKAVYQIEQLAPFGAGNARPLLCTSEVHLAAPPKRIGEGERHLSLQFVQHNLRLRAVAFGGGEWADELAGHVAGGAGGPLSIAFRPMINVFAGRRSVELEVEDWKKAGEEI